MSVLDRLQFYLMHFMPYPDVVPGRPRGHSIGKGANATLQSVQLGCVNSLIFYMMIARGRAHAGEPCPGRSISRQCVADC
jgi:hypothetical protein